ncbi:hypothetical protein Rin_00004890 [Candidatus Regiella insecticola 5.15]|uniref:Phage spike trimer domain-containing protein n=1 Tax=Candidatus Regiella insecticola 5.15 TaxID=1005043 RepID=G2GXJ7_9ENTR|nr:hypothetical protein Rin_00004890 [Candidatus Regiella insecticola 5.15]
MIVSEYKPDHLTILIKQGKITLDAPDVTVTGKLTVHKGVAIEGNIHVTGGDVAVSGDVVAGLFPAPSIVNRRRLTSFLCSPWAEL